MFLLSIIYVKITYDTALIGDSYEDPSFAIREYKTSRSSQSITYNTKKLSADTILSAITALRLI